MVLPVMTFSDPRLSQPIQPHGLNLALQSGIQTMGALDKNKLVKAQADYYAQRAKDPFGKQTLTGPAGQAYSDLLYRQKYGSDPSNMETLQHYKQFAVRSQNIRDFSNMSKDEIANLYGKFRAAGFSQDVAAKYLSNGYTLASAIESKKSGQDPFNIANNAETFNANKLPAAIQEVNHHTRPVDTNDIRPQYPVTTGALTAQQKAASATVGMSYLGKAINQGLNYGGPMSTITRPWFWDSRSSDPAKQEKAVRFYASHSLKPELALYRMRIQQGQASARAMKALEPTILGDIKPQLQHLSPNIQRRIQDRVRNVLEESTRRSSLQTLGRTPTITPKQQVTSTPQRAQVSIRRGSAGKPPPTQADFEHTAKVNNISVAEVKRRLGIK